MSVRYATVSAMRAAATSGFNTNVANTCYVDALGDFFNFKAGSTTPDVSNIVVSSSDALGKWHRMGIPPQTAAGAVLLYDASGNATAYAPGTAGQFLTSNGAGLQPTWQGLNNSGNAAGRLRAPVLLDRQTLAAVAAYTQPSFTAEAYRELNVIIDGTDSSGNAFCNMSLTGLTGTANGLGLLMAGGGVSMLNNLGVAATLYYHPGGTADINCEAKVFPLTTGRRRKYRSESTSPLSATQQGSTFRGDFADTTHGVTAVTLAFPAFTGDVEVWGVPA